VELEAGKLYKCSKYCLLIFPSKNKARAASTTKAGVQCTTAETAMEASSWGYYWSEQLNCRIYYSDPKEIFMFLKQEKEFLNVLFGDIQGWVVNETWLEISYAYKQSVGE
jgi:hypothetical protein